MSSSAGPDFVNRGEELRLLVEALRRVQNPAPALLILCGPTGRGKSRLTDQLVVTCGTELPHLLFCMVEPEIQVHADTHRLHNGYFIQRCAEQLSRMAGTTGAPWGTLAAFLESRRWRTVKAKKKEDWISDAPGFKSAYKIALDYVNRAFSVGTYAPMRLLASDSKEAVAICGEYVDAVLADHRVVLLVREAQHCDTQSMRTLVQWSQENADLDIILEYTTETGSELDPAHRKLLMRASSTRRNVRLVEVHPLHSRHLEQVIRSCVDATFLMTPEAYGRWDGNLHSVVELQFHVSIGQRVVNPLQIEQALGSLPSILSTHLGNLPSQHRLLLAICLAHVESISEDMIVQAAQAVLPATSPAQVQKALRELAETHRFLEPHDGFYRIHVEALIEAFHQLPGFPALLAAAERALRDLYCRQVFDADWSLSGLSLAVRQVFRLCARTQDAVGMRRAADVLSGEIERAQDPSLYAEIVASSISANSSLYGAEQDRLLYWAASLAYDVGNFELAERLLAMLAKPDQASDVMRACALQECGRHDEALQIAARLRESTASNDVRLAAALVEALVVGCRGECDAARALLAAAIAEPAYEQSPLLGFAHRFYEITEDNEGSIKRIQASIAWFTRFGMDKSCASSQAAAAVLLARTGDLEGARAMIDAAGEILAKQVRGRHLLLNNIAAVELLSPSPDYPRCVEVLAEALRYVRDDYSEVTVLTNLAIAHCGAGQSAAAIDCVDAALRIFDDHGFASVDVYWQVCFNAAQVLAALGYGDRSLQTLRWPESRAPFPLQNRAYWEYRFGRTTELPDSWHHLATREFHPLYLSLWLIDLEGINQLRPTPPQ